MDFLESKRGLRAECDGPFLQRGFRYKPSREAYARSFAEGAQYVHLRLIVVASVVRLELSASIRFERIEAEFHRTSGAATQNAKATSTLWSTAEELTGWPLDECHRRLKTQADINLAAHKVKDFLVNCAEPYFDAHRTVRDVAHELNALPSERTPHSAPPARAFYGVIAATLSGEEGLEQLIAQHRQALKGIDRGFHNERFERMVAALQGVPRD